MDTSAVKTLYEPPPQPSANLLSVLRRLNQSPERKRSLSNRQRMLESIPRLSAARQPACQHLQSREMLPPLRASLTHRSTLDSKQKTHRKTSSYGYVSARLLEPLGKLQEPASAPPEPEKRIPRTNSSKALPQSPLKIQSFNSQHLLTSLRGMSEAELQYQLHRYNVYL